MWLGVKGRGSSSILVSEGPCGSPADLVGVSLSDELGALGRVEVRHLAAPRAAWGASSSKVEGPVLCALAGSPAQPQHPRTTRQREGVRVGGRVAQSPQLGQKGHYHCAFPWLLPL